MKNKPLAFRQIEWWIVTLVFLIIVLVNILSAGNGGYHSFNDGLIGYFAKIIIPLLLFLVFYLFHKVLIPNYLKNKKMARLIILSVLIAIFSYIIITLFSDGANITKAPFTAYYFKIMAIYLGYLVWVIFLKQVLTPPKMKDYQSYNSIRLGSIFFFLTLFLLQIDQLVHRSIAFILAFALPSILLVLVYNYYLIYKNRQAGNRKAANWFNITLILFFPGTFIFIGLVENEGIPLLIGLGIGLMIQLVIIPISNLSFEKYLGMVGQIKTLSHKVEVGTANLSFLKSQINPHFLFNALNTLYGTALMENAEKTADGVQKLGDMMRFMIHENQQDKIPLKREIAYVKNYLDLQMLRFENEENLSVDFKLPKDECEGQIAPMLLIPFVENAFKHGISTKNKSWIRINLRCMEGTVHLDLVNSIHPKKITDDPKDESGIGLENVRKRLEHYYSGKFSLSTISNESEFFVHFSLQLD
ncbi:sensor histidine kinase [Cyclobacterium marinum]|uniref:Putative signal transduction histidine kinase n=1 Tax=Cyclobacterium marinum (strain ATCC 25205 / DSM 745 / LMG 13164 / NCIMB 1802) TaxID=880070 RepID=G0IVE8_CYCMS|nr:histidine kinase [Cyclobacterium marinum]AEL27947.1 putative signal transduction histidine kinase [Cyclobacterium marinum DSM 745]MBR9777757.1 histidine kinase [Cytophagales bacterium]